jgi:hypothetical protein
MIELSWNLEAKGGMFLGENIIALKNNTQTP